jgi:hypothetical protein
LKAPVILRFLSKLILGLVLMSPCGCERVLQLGLSDGQQPDTGTGTDPGPDDAGGDASEIDTETDTTTDESDGSVDGSSGDGGPT